LGRELNGDPRPVSFFSEDSTKAASSDFPIGDVNRMRKQISSFPDIARASFGQGANIFLSSILYFELFSCLCIFLVSIGDHLHMMIPHVSMNLHMIFVAALLVVPTALLRTPKLLSYLSVSCFLE
jgi:amino acid permease